MIGGRIDYQNGALLITEGAIQQSATQVQCTKTSQTRPPGTMQDSRFKIQDSSSSQDLRNQNQDAGIFESGDRMLVVCFLFYCLGSLQLWRLKGRFKQYLQ